MKQNEREATKLKVIKKERLEKARLDNETSKILEKNIPDHKLKKPELEILLLRHGVLKKDLPKGNVAKRTMWRNIKERKISPPIFETWTEKDEEDLNKLESEEIDITATALGRATSNLKLQINASFKTMGKGERKNFINEVQTLSEKTVEKEETEIKQENIKQGAKKFLPS